MSNEQLTTVPNVCECDAFMAACLTGTDNEMYGRLFDKWGGGWHVGSDLPLAKYCPWCGKELP
jgi:hypothetical protein